MQALAVAGGCGAGPQPRARGQGAEAAEVAEVLVVVPGGVPEAGVGVGVHPQLPPPQRLPPDVPDQARDGAAGRGRGGGGGDGVTRGQ